MSGPLKSPRNMRIDVQNQLFKHVYTHRDPAIALTVQPQTELDRAGDALLYRAVRQLRAPLVAYERHGDPTRLALELDAALTVILTPVTQLGVVLRVGVDETWYAFGPIPTTH